MSEQVQLSRRDPPDKRRAVIITGLSGAGKTNALKAFEDAGYYCIDNLPPAMIPNVLALASAEKDGPAGVVVVVDIRGSRYFGKEIAKSISGFVGGEDASW